MVGRSLFRSVPAPVVGLFGKLPSRGDFISANMPRDVMDAAEGWSRAGLMALTSEPGWEPHYLSAPIWQFAVARREWGASSWCGVLLPSVDSVGRFFPLVIGVAARSLSGTALARMQDLAQEALDPQLADLDAWKRAVVGIDVGADRSPDLVAPARGGTFRALDTDGGALAVHAVERLDAHSFVQLFRAPAADAPGEADVLLLDDPVEPEAGPGADLLENVSEDPAPIIPEAGGAAAEPAPVLEILQTDSGTPTP